MKTVQVVIEEDLLRAADAAARRNRVNRSALFREALEVKEVFICSTAQELRELHLPAQGAHRLSPSEADSVTGRASRPQGRHGGKGSGGRLGRRQ